ncbi:hypothetical protein ACA910_019339 [Epithemia clementina (nom. ined.)]
MDVRGKECDNQKGDADIIENEEEDEAGKVEASSESITASRRPASLTVDDDDEDNENKAYASVSDEKEDSESRLHDKKWDEMLNRLMAYKRENGHCLVPNRYPDDPSLGSWVSTQRRQHRILLEGGNEPTSMTEERIARLEAIGFQWSTKDPRHVPWQHRYDQLVAFKERFGHSQVPIGWEENVQLSNWVSTQRQEYKLMQKGRSSRLTSQRIDLLDKVSFVWEAQRGGPRRKRKATVEVPKTANPVVGIGPQARASSTERGQRSHQSNFPRPFFQQPPQPLAASEDALRDPSQQQSSTEAVRQDTQSSTNQFVLNNQQLVALSPAIQQQLLLQQQLEQMQQQQWNPSIIGLPPGPAAAILTQPSPPFSHQAHLLQQNQQQLSNPWASVAMSYGMVAPNTISLQPGSTFYQGQQQQLFEVIEQPTVIPLPSGVFQGYQQMGQEAPSNAVTETRNFGNRSIGYDNDNHN